MKGSLTSNPEIFNDNAWNVLVMSEESAKKWRHNQLNVEHVIQVIFSNREYVDFTQKTNIDINELLDLLEDLLEDLPEINNERFFIGEDLEILLENANFIKDEFESNLIEIPHLIIAIAQDKRIGKKLFKEFGLDSEIITNIFKPIQFSNSITSDISQNPNKIESSQYKVKNNNLQTKDNNSNSTENLSETNSPIKLYCQELTQTAARGDFDPVIGREDEINDVIRVLTRRTKNNPILIGPPGVGKTAIVQLLAQKIVINAVPKSISGLKLISLDFGALISGTKFRGQLEERLRELLNELIKPQEGFILFIDELHTFINSDRSSIDITSFLKPLLANGDLRCIGTTTPEKYRATIEKDPGLERCFQQVRINEPSIQETIEILKGSKKKFELHHGIFISHEAIESASQLADRYISDRFLPDKAIDLIDEAAAQLKIESTNKPKIINEAEEYLNNLENKIQNSNNNQPTKSKKLIAEIEGAEHRLNELIELWEEEKLKLEEFLQILKEEDLLKKDIIKNNSIEISQRFQENKEFIEMEKIRFEKYFGEIKKNNNMLCKNQILSENIANIVSNQTGIPVNKVISTERKKLLSLEKDIALKVIGQKKSVLAICSAIRRARAGMKDPRRPIGSFLFLGPTGVGKTELAKALANTLFDEEESLIRLDMSEYMERNAVARLIGAPPGYVGYEEGGQLTEAIRRKPYSVVLLDEIEKAHSEVFNILLQVLDEGRLTDSQGRTIDFKNTIIILTSNIASRNILEDSKIRKKNLKEKNVLSLDEIIQQSLKKIFKPEFLNRIDETIRFDPLKFEEIKQIINLQINDLKNLLSEQGITIELDEKVILKLAEEGYEPEFGARPLKRVLRKRIENPLASKLLKNDFPENSNIKIQYDESSADQIKFLAND
tara:strand:+ start:3136 stop:5826 length:2691 start_codon:yes stop_codon:yes gene_type:complete